MQLRLIDIADAEYVTRLRSSPNLNLYLSPTTGGEAEQRRWINAYKKREAQQREVYFVIETLEAIPCGLVRLYDLQETSFTWGSWILDPETKPKGAAFDSLFLSFGFGFETLAKSTAYLDVRRDNTTARRVYESLSLSKIKETEADLYFSYDLDAFHADCARLCEKN